MTPSCAQAAALPPLATAAGGQHGSALSALRIFLRLRSIGFGSVLCSGSTSLASMPSSSVASGGASGYSAEHLDGCTADELKLLIKARGLPWPDRNDPARAATASPEPDVRVPSHPHRPAVAQRFEVPSLELVN